jgi:hypothetical protein
VKGGGGFMSNEIDFDNPDPDFIPNCEGHGIHYKKCPHIGTRTVIDPDPNAAGAPVHLSCFVFASFVTSCVNRMKNSKGTKPSKTQY